jgi:transcriptional regulator with XRE-family HTH domain
MLLAWTARSCTMEHMLSTLEDEVSLRMGRAVKQRREAAGFSLRMLAARSGISSSMISDIERGTKSPTVSTMLRLADALGVSAATLVGEGTGPALRIHVLRRGEGAGGQHPAPWESLGPAASGSRIDFVRYQIPPSTVLGPSAAHASDTVEHMHVAAGTVRVTVGDETAELSAGDSCSCRTDAPHGVENPDPSAEALIYLIVERG